MKSESGITINLMNPNELHRISELDRSEHVTQGYELIDGELTQVEVDWNVLAWFVDNEGDHSLSEQISFCSSHLSQGGVMLGAFDDDLLVGIAVVRPRLRDDLAQLPFLHVSRGFRRQGIARMLMWEACKIARKAGSSQLYISSIPSSSAVGFYLSQGCRLAEEVDPELYTLEPEDIHLILDL